MENSIQTSNTNILTLLTDAGAEGLHKDDILYLLNFPDKKTLNQRLNDLTGRCLIAPLEGGRYKKIDKEQASEPVVDSNGGTFVTPSLTEDLPRIHLPGDNKFSSYKNSLQEYCQKKHMSVPVYGTEKTSLGLVGKVTFSLNHVKAEKGESNVKEAEARAAYDALKKLGYLKDHDFSIINQLGGHQLKRGSEQSLDAASSVAKQLKKEDIISINSAKSLLNEFAQKKGIPCPVYNSVPVAGGFLSTCTFNGHQFKSNAICKKRKEAEHNAAQVTLHGLDKSHPLPPGDDVCTSGELDITLMVSEARQATQKPTPGSLKNRLQEYCQRRGKALPKYTTVLVDEQKKLFSSTVVVDCIDYVGEAQNNKKTAETAAAAEALKKLELMA